MKKLAVLGTGYVGLVTGACLAQVGHQVICADIDTHKIDLLQQGIMPIYEPGLEQYVKDNAAQGRLHFTTDLAGAIRASEVIFIAVGTPPKPSGSADLSYVWEAARTIGRNLNGFKVVVDKSTVPVHTAAEVRRLIAVEAVRVGLSPDFEVVSNPEFLREGIALKDFMEPDRIVIGVSSPRAAEVMREVYRYWLDRNYPLVVMDPTSAEMTKYAANALLAAKISFINEIANICDAVGADVELVRQGIGLDHRIGPHFLYAGLGYGGSCFPKDVQALIVTAKENGYLPRLLVAVEEINRDQRLRFVNRIRRFFNPDLQEQTLAIWGLSFKPDTDDIREAPAVTLIEELLPEVGRLQVFDPHAMPAVQRHFAHHPLRDKIIYGRNVDLDPAAQQQEAYRMLDGAAALIICTEYQIFREADPRIIGQRLQQKVIFDGRNIFDPQTMRELGFTYFCIGRPC